MSSDQYVAVSEEEMILENYPCGLEAGNYIVPKEDIYVPDEAGNPSLYLKKGLRCLVLTGNPQEPEIIWFRICATGEIATWDDTILDSFEPAPPKPEILPDTLLGKNLLVGIVRYDSKEGEIDRESHLGPVISATDELVTIHETGNPENFTIPFDPKAFEECDRELVFTFGDVKVSGVDFISQWRVHASSEE